jgi:hypothetical protein
LSWHARVKRREAEAIRDAVLQVSGQLNPSMHGPSACPELPAALADYGPDPNRRPCDRNRRSVYMLAKRNFTYPLLAAFDQPDRVNSCPVRAVTVTAPQALAMLNGEFTLVQARHVGGALLAAHGRDVRALIRAAYLCAFCREPDRDEMAAAEKFLNRQAQLIVPAGKREGKPPGDAFAAAVVDFCHALINSAEFLDVE